jgi:hypothetical protein
LKKVFNIIFVLSIMIALTACGGIELDQERIDTESTEFPPISENISSEPVETVNNNINSSENNNSINTDDNSNSNSNSLKIIGRVTYDRIKVNSNGRGLNYRNITREPAKQVVVKGLDNKGRVVATTTTDNNGEYSLTNLQRDKEIQIRVYAQLEKSGISSWSVKVVDNTNRDSQYTVEGSLLSTGQNNTRRDIHASSGWNGSSYANSRDAAPFAILGSIYQAIEKVILADSTAIFPALIVNWSENNIASGEGTDSQLREGQIVTSHFNGENKLYILGDANSDTDEYDDHIIIHEWGHYFEDQFSRTDSIGGPHSDGDRLDIRVAFGEGWGNAWSAIATDNPIYFDTMDIRQSGGWSMDIEENTNSVPGWFSETSIQEILYDLYDSHDDNSDTISLGFQPIYKVLVGSQKTTPALTSIFSFIKGLKDENPRYIDKIDELLLNADISIIDDIYGSEHHQLYSNMQQGTVGQICTSNEYGGGNKLNAHKYIRFSISIDKSYRVRVEQNNGSNTDPDFILYQTTPVVREVGSAQEIRKSREEASYSLATGGYILDVSDYNNISNACFDITIN